MGVPWVLDLTELAASDRARVMGNWSRALGEDLDPHDPAVPVFTLSSEPLGERDGIQLDPGPDAADDLDYAISRALTVATISRRAGSALILHAAGLAAPDGRTVVLVAQSGTGKSTASRVLGRHLGYVSDETVVIEDDDAVTPYPKPLSLIREGGSRTSKGEHSPDDLGLLPTPAHPKLAAVVLLERDPDCPVPSLSRIPLVDGIVDALPQTSSVLALPEPLRRLARALRVGGGPWRLTYAEIEDCVELLTLLLTEGTSHSHPTLAPTPAPAWEGFAGGGPSYPVLVTGVRLGPDDVVVRQRFDEAVVSEGRVAVLIDGHPLRLDGLGTYLWQAAATPQPLHALVDGAQRELGAHPDAQRLVFAAAAELAAHRLLADGRSRVGEGVGEGEGEGLRE